MPSTNMHPPNKEYRPAPESYNDFVFVDLNLGIPQPDPEWLREHLAQTNRGCEWPKCDKVASVMLITDQFTPLVCVGHAEWINSPTTKMRVFARRVIKNEMKDEFFVAEYGSRKRSHDDAPKAITVAFVPYDQRDLPPIRRLNLPKLGQVGA